MGPWAIYEGMEHFKSQRAELDEEQKETMRRYEEMRKERVDEHKGKRGKGVDGEKEYSENEVHRATTIYHGVNGDYGANKGFVDHPAYLRPKEHACFIPKKWLHTWVGHNKGV